MFLRELQGRKLYSVMSACCGASFMLYGYDAGVLGGIQNEDSFLNAIGNPTGDLTIPIIASIYNLAAFVSSMFTAVVGMKIGRRKTILMGNVCIIIGATLQAATFSVAQIVVGRIICGFGIGFIASAVPTYMSEMSLEAKERGPEVSKQGALLITGVALAYWIDYGFVQSKSQIWRIPIALQSCFAVFSIAGFLFLPDTPRWYYARDRIQEGDDVLARLYELPPDHKTVTAMRKTILAAIKEERKNKLQLITLVWDNTPNQVGRRLRTSFLILFVQQLLGINMLVYYSTTIFSEIGYDKELSSILAAVLNTVFAIACFPPIWTIERHGRRPMMFWAAFGCGICLIVFTTVSNIEHQTKALGWVAAAAVIVYDIIFGYGWLGPPWVYGPEIAPLEQRHIAGALGAAGEWLSTFLMVFGGGYGIKHVGPMIWIWPIICCFLTMAFVYFYCPETTGKTLEEIDYIFASPELKAKMDAEGRGVVPAATNSSDEEKATASHEL